MPIKSKIVKVQQHTKLSMSNLTPVQLNSPSNHFHLTIFESMFLCCVF